MKDSGWVIFGASQLDKFVKLPDSKCLYDAMDEFRDWAMDALREKGYYGEMFTIISPEGCPFTFSQGWLSP